MFYYSDIISTTSSKNSEHKSLGAHHRQNLSSASSSLESCTHDKGDDQIRNKIAINTIKDNDNRLDNVHSDSHVINDSDSVNNINSCVTNEFSGIDTECINNVYSENYPDFGIENEEYESETYGSVHSSDNETSKNEIEENFLFDRIMFQSSNLTVRDVITLSTAFSLRFHLSDEARLACMDLLKFCAGPGFINLPLSKYTMGKCCSSQDENVTYHYFCQICSNEIIYSVKGNEKIKKKNVVCNKCKKKDTINNVSPNYFTCINLKYQIRLLFNNDNICNDLFENLKVRSISKKKTDIIKDVHDG